MKKIFPNEFSFQVFSLLVAFIVVHAVYITLIRPEANEFIAQERAQMQIDPEYIQQRSLYVVVKDFEQEACFILMLWALAILAYKGVDNYEQRKNLDQDFIGSPERNVFSHEELEVIVERLKNIPVHLKENILPRLLSSVAERFTSTHDIQSASVESHHLCEEESERLESELSIIRYIAWAIPSIGFIGTVRGIGNALAQAHQAIDGDITGVTESLGVAFNSTFIALVISIFLMFIIHQIQLMQERLVLGSKRYCAKWLIGRLPGNRAITEPAHEAQ